MKYLTLLLCLSFWTIQLFAQVQADSNAVKVKQEAPKKEAPINEEDKPVTMNNEIFVEMSTKVVFNGKLKKELLSKNVIMIKVDDVSQIYYQMVPIYYKEFQFLLYDNTNIIRRGGNYFYPLNLDNINKTDWVLSFKIVRENDKPITGIARYEITHTKMKLKDLEIN